MATNTTNFNWLIPAVGGDGDIWGDYLNSNITDQDALVRRMINNFINSSAPAEAQAGTFWIDNTTNPLILKVYDGSDWIDMGSINTTSNTFTPSATSSYIGDYKFSAQTADHGSWLLCDGSSVSTTTYSGLFALIGYNFGGAGSSFNLPDMRGRVPGSIGSGPGLTTRALGASVGEEEHVLTVDELAAHGHTFNPKSDSNTNGATPATAVGVSNRSDTSGIADTTFIQDTGGDSAHNNMQPTLFVGNHFIFSGV
jgi:microcystin-dependent protein